jgi:starch synthase
MPKILMAASEATPFAKTGGLADVMGALPLALKARGEDVAVAIPRYRCISIDGAWRVLENQRIWLGPTSYTVQVYETVERDVPYFLIDCPPLYDREGLYSDGKQDFPDNHVRFAVFCQAVLAIGRHLFRPRILHCHDWQAGLIPIYLKTLLWGDPTFAATKCLFTIHNLGYLGLFEPAALAEIGLDAGAFQPDGVEFYGHLSLLKGALWASDAISTVSPRYAREIQTPEYGAGLDGLLRARAGVLSGILNGADYSEWNPETDPYIAARYSASDLAGKRLCKQDLLDEFGLPREAAARPLIGILSRLTGQKGFDLLEDIAAELAAEDCSLVALGTGEPRYEKLLLDLAAAHPDKVAVRIAYDNALAHKIEAGADLFLMPSRYEPCGLSQFYSLRYGTVPVVRATGGLDDSVDEETGFKFEEYSAAALLGALRAALAAYAEPVRWAALMTRGMSRDFSWDASAAEYARLYRRLGA